MFIHTHTEYLSCVISSAVSLQEKIPLVNENEVSEMSKPPSPRKTLAAAPGLSTCMASTQVAQSAPFSPPPSDQYTTPPTSAVAHKASPPSSVASSSMDHPVQSRATSSPRHVTLVLPEGPATSASTSAQPSTRHIPKPTNVAPIHLTSLCVLTTLEEDGEEEDGEEEVEEKKEVHAPVSSSLLKTLSSLTLTPEMALHATLVPPHQQSRHGQLEECQPANPSNQQEECQPANPSYQPYQESPSRGKSDRDQGGTGSGAAGGVRESGWTQTEAAGMGSIGSRWKRNFAGLGSLGSGGQRREEDAPCSSTALRSPTLIDLAPPRLLGAWTENTATVPTPIGGGGGGLDWRSGGLPTAQRTSPTLCSQLISPPVHPSVIRPSEPEPSAAPRLTGHRHTFSRPGNLDPR